MATEVQFWQLILAAASAMLAFGGLNVLALRWLLGPHDWIAQDNAKKLAELQRDILRLCADLPLEYVRREDWIRFGNVLDAKMDANRAEMREALAGLHHELAQCSLNLSPSPAMLRERAG